MTEYSRQEELFPKSERYSLSNYIDFNQVEKRLGIRFKQTYRWLRENPVIGALMAIFLAIIANIATKVLTEKDLPSPYEHLSPTAQRNVDLRFQLELEDAEGALETCLAEKSISEKRGEYFKIGRKTKECNRLAVVVDKAGGCTATPGDCYNNRRVVLAEIGEIERVSVAMNNQLRKLAINYTGREDRLRRDFLSLVASTEHTPYIQADLYFRWAIVESAFGNINEAHNAYVEAASLMPSRTELVRAAHESSVRVGDNPQREHWLNVLLAQLETSAEGADVERVRAMWNVARDAEKTGQFELSLDVVNRALYDYSSLPKPVPSLLADLLNARGLVLQSIGDFNAAEGDLRRVVHIREEIGTRDAELSKLLGQAYMNLALLIMDDKSRIEEAISLADKNLALRLTTVASPDQNALSLAYHSRAKILWRAGQNANALSDIEKAMGIRKPLELEGKVDARLQSIRNSQAMLVMETDARKAIEILDDVDALMSDLYGENHKSVASIKINKAKALKIDGQYKQAMSELVLALEIREPIYSGNYQKMIDIYLPMAELNTLFELCDERNERLELVKTLMKYGSPNLAKFQKEIERISSLECK